MIGSRKKSRPIVNGRPLTGAQAVALRTAARTESAGQPARARQIRIRLETAIADAAEADWARDALAETAALERARGATLERRSGRIRLIGKDGLEGAGLEPGLLAAGRRYRERFEAAQDRPGSALNLRPGGGRGRSGVPEGVAARLVQARRDVERMERSVLSRYAADGRPGLAADALMVVREVAGLGRAIRELASSGGRRAALKTRLREALSVLSPHARA